MKKYLFFLAALVAGCSNLYSQWNVVNTGTTEDLYSVDYASASDIWIGSFNKFTKTANGGVSWTVTSPVKDNLNLDIQPVNLTDIRVISPANALAAGFFLIGNVEYILNTSNGGANWNYASTNTSTGAAPRYMNALDMSGIRAVAVGANGRILKSTNSGSTWSLAASGVTSMIYDVAFGTYDTVYAVGDNKVFRSVNGGTTWVASTISGGFESVSCDRGVIYVGNHAAQSMLKSTNYGSSYTTINLPFAYQGILYAVNKDTVLAAGTDGVYVSFTGGQYWEKYVLPAAYQRVRMFDFLNSSTGMMVGNGGYALHTANLAATPSVPLPIFSIAGSPANICLNDSVTFNNTTAPIAGYTYDWKLNGVTFSTQAAAGVRFHTAGPQVITLTVTNGFGSATATLNVTVIGHDVDPVVYAAFADSVCSGTPVGFTIPVSQTGTTYQLRKGFLNIGAAQPGTGGALTFTYSTPVTATTTFNIRALKTTPCFTDSLVQSKTIYVVPAAGGPAATCTPYINSCTSEGITNVTIGTINNTTNTLIRNYFDYSCCQHTNLVMGVATPVSVTVLNAMGENVKIWIDFNNDGSFTGPGELVFSGNAAPVISGTITVPPTAMIFNQKLRMRVASDYDLAGLTDPCFLGSFYCGQVEDYAVTVLPAPVAPTPAFTKVATFGCTTSVAFTNTSYNATSYTWDFGDGSATATTMNATHVYTVSGTYTVSLTSCNPTGCNTTTQTLNITIPLVPVAAACNPVMYSGYVSSLTNFQFDTLSVHYSTMVSNPCVSQIRLHAGSTYDITMQGTSTSSSTRFGIWIDYNNNGVFSPSEVINAASGRYTLTVGYNPPFPVQIPLTAVQNTPLRMRVLLYDGTYHGYITDGCAGGGAVRGGGMYEFTVFVDPPLPVTAGFTTSATTVCTGTNIAFTNTSVNATSYLWDFGDGVTSIAASPNHMYATAGTYTVKLIADNGAYTDSVTSVITVNAALPTPVITFSGGVLSTAAGASSYQWYRNGTIISGATAATYTPTLDGTYKVIAYNGACSATSANFSYFPVHINFSASPLSSCFPATVNFTNTTTAATSYAWDFGDGATSTATNPSHTYTAAGTYTVKLVACNTTPGCDSLIRTAYITVNSPPDALTTTPAPTICTGTATSIALTGSFAGTTFSWTVTQSGVSGASAGSGPSIAQTLTATGSAAGTATYVVTPSSGGCSGIPLTITVTVMPLPAPAVISQSANVLSSSAATGNQWYLDGVLVPSATAPTYTVTQEGSYTVTYTNGSGCTSTSAAYFADAVWPGDANNDLVANNYDLSQIGIFYGNSGAARATISTAWQQAFVQNWGPVETNGTDIKHVDCNGDGVINSGDMAAITANFSATHLLMPYTSMARSTDPELYFVSSGSTYAAGDWVDVDIMAGTPAIPVSDLYGLAFDMLYDASVVQPGTDTMIFPVSFFGTPNVDLIAFANISAPTNTVSAAETRIDHINANGYGKIATFRFRVDSTLAAPVTGGFSIPNYSANDSAGAPVLFNASATYSLQYTPATTTGIAESTNSIQMAVSPNPYYDRTTISYSLDAPSAVSLDIYNAIGQHVLSLANGSQGTGTHRYSFSAKEKGLDAGVYFVKIMINGKASMRKIVEMK